MNMAVEWKTANHTHEEVPLSILAQKGGEAAHVGTYATKGWLVAAGRKSKASHVFRLY